MIPLLLANFVKLLMRRSSPGVAVVPSFFLEPDDNPQRMPEYGEFVLKPAIGATLPLEKWSDALHAIETRQARADLMVLGRVLKEIDHLGQFAFGLFLAGHVGEGVDHPGVVLEIPHRKQRPRRHGVSVMNRRYHARPWRPDADRRRSVFEDDHPNRYHHSNRIPNGDGNGHSDTRANGDRDSVVHRNRDFAEVIAELAQGYHVLHYLGHGTANDLPSGPSPDEQFDLGLGFLLDGIAGCLGQG
jgi:hypothetical protein